MGGFTFSRLYSFSIRPENAVDEMQCINDAGSKTGRTHRGLWDLNKTKLTRALSVCKK